VLAQHGNCAEALVLLGIPAGTWCLSAAQLFLPVPSRVVGGQNSTHVPSDPPILGGVLTFFLPSVVTMAPAATTVTTHCNP
jgi:hypothetical protein